MVAQEPSKLSPYGMRVRVSSPAPFLERIFMAHPCKQCLVRPACSQSCNEWKRYSSNAASLMTFVSVLLSAIIMGPIIIWLCHISDTTNKEWPRLAVMILWLGSFSASTIIQAPLDDDAKITFFPRLVFAPFVFICLVLIHSVKNYFRRA